jgi:hypothetical protein
VLTTTPWGPVQSSLEARFRPISLRTAVRAQEERSSRRSTASTQRARLVPRPHRAPPGDARAHFVGTLCHGRARRPARAAAPCVATQHHRGKRVSGGRAAGGASGASSLVTSASVELLSLRLRKSTLECPRGVPWRVSARWTDACRVGGPCESRPDKGRTGTLSGICRQTPRSFLRRAPTRQGELGVAKSSLSVWVRGLGPPRASSPPARPRESRGTSLTSSVSCADTRASTAESEIPSSSSSTTSEPSAHL